MNRPFLDRAKDLINLRFFLFLLCFAVSAILVGASVPGWWSSSNPAVLKGENAQDYGAVNQGQVKNIAKAAVGELDRRLPGGAGEELRDMISAWENPTTATTDYAAVNLGQLKALAKPFYDRLIAVQYVSDYPWAESGNSANDYAMANIGQVKSLFSFDLTNTDPEHDADYNGLADWWELFHFEQTGTDPSLDPDGDGFSTLEEFQQGGSPTDFYSRPGRGFPVQIGKVSGDTQTGVPGKYLNEPLVVEIRDSSNQPVSNAPVEFIVLEGGGVLSQEAESPASFNTITRRTDANGRVSAYYRLGAVLGVENRIKAQAGAGNAVEFICASSPQLYVTPVEVVVQVNAGDQTVSHLTLANGSHQPVNYGTQILGAVRSTVLSHQGDAFGYRWGSSKDVDGPVYLWEEISTTGTHLASISSADNAFTPVSLPFEFPFYGQLFSEMFVCSNGHITFGEGNSDYEASALPLGTRPGRLIAALHKNLDTAVGGDVYYKADQRKAIIQFSEVANRTGGGTYTFQIVLHKGGSINFYYKTISGAVNNATVGIQNSTKDVGFSIAYGTAFLESNLAILISNVDQEWLTVSPSQGTLAEQADGQIALNIDASKRTAGNYLGQIQFYDQSGSVPSGGTNLTIQVVDPPSREEAPVRTAAPEFSIPGGMFTRYATVSLSCGTQGAVIRYTLDGSEPTVDSFIYSSPIPLGITTTLKARAWCSGYEASPVVSAEYRLSGKIAVGLEHVLALGLDGRVSAWGAGGSGRLGIGGSGDRKTPELISSLVDVVDVASGPTHSAVVKADGTLWTWGANSDGQLAKGSTTASSSPAAVNGINDAIAVAAGEAFTLVLRGTSGIVYGAGYSGSEGRLGNGTTSTPNMTFGNPVVRSNGEVLSGIKAIAVKGRHSLALTSNGNVFAWGKNDSGQLGDNSQTNRIRAVQSLNNETNSALANIVAIATGTAHSAAVDGNGYVWAWGLNSSGQLGDGTSSLRARAVRMKIDASTYFTGAVSVAAGANFTLVTKSDGTLWACGNNAAGNLGIGSTANQLYLKQVLTNGKPLDGVFSSGAGQDFAVALNQQGEVYSWGSALSGKLGNGTTSPNVTTATKVPGFRLSNHRPVLSFNISGSTVAPATNVTLSTSATDADGQDVNVDLYFSDVLIGSATGAPYQLNLASIGFGELGVGLYKFRAVATDPSGGVAEAFIDHVVSPPPDTGYNAFFRRGAGSEVDNYSSVIALDFEKGTPLDAVGFNPARFPAGLPWLSNVELPLLRQFSGWASTPGVINYLYFQNPIVAFGADTGGSPLYKGREYRFGAQLGGPLKSGTTYASFPQIRIDVYNKQNGAKVGTKYISLPVLGNPADAAKWESFVRNGFTWPTPQYPDSAFLGLETQVKVVSLSDQSAEAWGSQYPGYILTHKCSSDEYGYVISAAGVVTEKRTNPVILLSMVSGAFDAWNSLVYGPLYSLDFTTRSPWQSEVVDRPAFQGKPMPSLYVGKSLEELLAASGNIDIPLSITPDSYKTLNHSPELRRHPTLDQLASDLTAGLESSNEKAVAICNFVLNEIELSEPLGYNEGGDISAPSISPGGIQRGAYATYMEGQGAPHEQCALLVYLLRQAGIPATYLFPAQDKLLMLDARLSTMLGFQVKGLLDPLGQPMPTHDENRPSLIPVNYPWVAVYVDDKWVHVFPWLKDVEVDEGYDLYGLMPDGYKNAHQWIAKYLACDPAIEDLIVDDDTPAALFPKFIQKALSDNHSGLTIDDVGARVRARKHYFDSLASLPQPFELTGTPTIYESLKDRPNAFDTIQIKVSAVNGVNSDGSYASNKSFETAEMPLMEFFNRKLLIHQTKNDANSTNVRLIMNPFDKGISGTGAFDGTFANMGKRQEKALSPRLQNTVADKFLQVSFKLKRQRSFSPPSGIGKWDAYMGLTSASLIEKSALVGKGDLAALCLNFGRVTARMLDVHAQEFWSVQGANNTNQEVYAGTPVYLMGMAYYKRLSDFNEINYNLHKARLLSNFGTGTSVLGAQRDSNGNLPSGDINLRQPYVDMLLEVSSSVGNGTLRPDSGEEKLLGGSLGALAMFITNGSAQEHAVIDQFYSKSDSISTVKLLRMAKKDPVNYPQAFYVLNKSNHLQYDGAMNALDPGIWTAVKEAFQAADGNHLTAYITSKKVSGASGAYTGIGALTLGLNRFQALISKNLNGGYASYTSVYSPASSTQITLTLANTASYSSYSVNTLPALTTITSTPITLSLPTVSYGSVYSVVQQANYGAFSVSPAQTNYWSSVGSTLNLGFSTTITSQNYGAGLSAVKNQGYLGSGNFTGAAFNWVADPVHVMTGAFYHDEADLTLPGPMPLEIRRNYNSLDLGDGELGYGWRFSMVPYLVMPAKQGSSNSDPVSNPATDIYAAEMDGSVIVYSRVGSTNEWVPTSTKNPQLANIWKESIGSGANIRNAKIVRSGTNNDNTVYTLTSADGSVRVFKIRSYPVPGSRPSGVAEIPRKRPYLESWTDNRSNKFTFTFGGDNAKPDYGLLKRINSSNGMFIGFNYNAYGQVMEAYTSDGRWVYYGYNPYGDLDSVIRPDGSVFKYEYKLKSATVGGKTEWTSTHLISRALSPEGRILENDYDAENRVVTQRATVGEGNALVVNGTFIYSNTKDSNDNTLSGYTLVTDAYNRTTRYDYSGSQITKITDPLNRQTTYEWYGLNQSTGGAYPRSLKKVTDPRGLQKSYSYDAAGNLVSLAISGDLTGSGSFTTATTTTSYNARNLPLEIVKPGGLRTVFAYGDPSQPYLPTFIENFAGSTSISRTVREYGTAGSGSISAKGVVTREISAQGTADEAVVEFTYDKRGFLTQTTRHTGTEDPDVVVSSRYNLRGELVEETDALGRKTAYAYDAQGRQIWVERLDEHGALVSWNYTYYNGNGEVTWTDGPRFEPEDYVWRRYDGGGRLIEESVWRSQAKADGSGVEAPAGLGMVATTAHRYNAFGDLIQTVDPRGFATTMEYDAIGRLLQKQRRAGGSESSSVLATESYTYEPGGEVATYTNPLGGVTTNEYTATGLLKRQERPDGIISQWRYGIDGRLGTEINPNGTAWHIVYDDAARRVTRTLKDAQGNTLAVETQRYDRRGNLIESTDAEGNVFSTTYDALNRVKTQKGPAGIADSAQRKVTYSYDAAGKRQLVTNALGEITTTTNDALGRPVAIEIKAADTLTVNTSTYLYRPDHHGYIVTRGTGSDAIFDRVFSDTQGRQVLLAHADSTFSLNRYDAAGNLVTSVDELGRATACSYDALGRLVQEQRPGGEQIDYNYDAAGNLKERILPGGIQWEASYDTSSRRLTEKLKNGSAETRDFVYTYHTGGAGIGRLGTVADPRGITKSYTYDLRGRLQQVVAVGVQPEANLSLEYEYDRLNRLTRLEQKGLGGNPAPGNVIERRPGAYGETLKEEVRLGGAMHSSYRQSWDGAGRRTALTPTGDPGKAQRFAWRADGLLIGTGIGIAPNATEFVYSYGNHGLLLSGSGPGRSRSVAQRDNRGRPLNIATAVGGAEALSETLEWRADSTLASYGASRNGTGAWNESRAYQYDAGGRLTVEPYAHASNSLSQFAYAFDNGGAGGLGVRTQANLTGVQSGQWQVPTGQVDLFGRIVQEARTGLLGSGTKTNSYDAAGNVTGRTLPGGKTQSLKWDGFGRLVEVQERDSAQNGYNWSAVYDGFGRRLKTTYHPVTGGTPSGAATEVASTYDPEVEFLEIETRMGSESWRKLYGPDGEGQYGEHQGIGGLEAVIASGAAATVPVVDYYGHVAGWVNGTTLDYTAAVRSLGYGPAPGETASVLELTANYTRALAWQGRRIDPTGIIWQGARYYEPESGRFISTDPLGHAASLSLYDYANGDPVNRMDPTGRISTSFSSNSTWGSGSSSYLYTSTALASGQIADYSPVVHQYKQDPVNWGQVGQQIARTAFSLPGLNTLRAGVELASGREMFSQEPIHRGYATLNFISAVGSDSVALLPSMGTVVTARPTGVAVTQSLSAPVARGEMAVAAKTAGQLALPAPSVVPNAGGVIRSFLQETDQIYYRVFTEVQTGSFLTAVKPGSSTFAQKALALPPQNTAAYIQEVLVPAGTRLQRSRALPAFGQPGGAEQFQLLNRIPNENFGAGVPFP